LQKGLLNLELDLIPLREKLDEERHCQKGTSLEGWLKHKRERNFSFQDTRSFFPTGGRKQQKSSA
jgi:hypothetical protein